MTKLLKILYLLLLTTSVTCWGTLVKMEELARLDGLQTIILGADCHIKEVSQVDDILGFIKTYNVDTVIEGGNSKDNAPILLSVLSSALKDAGKTFYDPEFRNGFMQLAVLIIKSLELSYTECKEVWQRDDVKKAAFHRIIKARDEGHAMLKELSQGIAQLHKNNICTTEEVEILYTKLDSIGALYNEVYCKIKSAFKGPVSEYEQDVSDLAAFAFNEAFSEGENGSTIHSLVGLDEKLFTMSNQLLDLRIVLHILHARQKSVILVCAGKVHTDQISEILQELKFVLQSKSEQALDKEAAQKNSKSDNPFDLNWESSPKLKVQEFINACKTLQKNPPALAA